MIMVKVKVINLIRESQGVLIGFGIRFGLPSRIWFVLKDSLMGMVKLRDGGYLIFKCGMFSFMRKIEVRGEEFLGRIGLRF